MAQRNPRFTPPVHRLDFKTGPGPNDVIAFEPLQMQEMYSHLCLRYETQLELLEKSAPTTQERWLAEGSCAAFETMLTYLLAQCRLFGEPMPDARIRDVGYETEQQKAMRDPKNWEQVPMPQENKDVESLPISTMPETEEEEVSEVALNQAAAAVIVADNINDEAEIEVEPTSIKRHRRTKAQMIAARAGQTDDSLAGLEDL